MMAMCTTPRCSKIHAEFKQERGDNIVKALAYAGRLQSRYGGLVLWRRSVDAGSVKPPETSRCMRDLLWDARRQSERLKD